MNEKEAKKIMDNVQATYNEIASEFSATRNKSGEEFSLFSKYIDAKSKIADIGCGNGRVLGYLLKENIKFEEYTGVDNSEGLLSIAKKKYPGSNFLYGDLRKLPLHGDSIDLLLCLRAFHHLPSLKLRTESLQDFKRVLDRSGIIFISVWNLWSIKNLFLFIKAALKMAFSFGKYAYNDLFVRWGKNHTRYYHAFSFKELKSLLLANGFKIIYSEKGRDLIFIVRK